MMYMDVSGYVWMCMDVYGCVYLRMMEGTQRQKYQKERERERKRTQVICIHFVQFVNGQYFGQFKNTLNCHHIHSAHFL